MPTALQTERPAPLTWLARHRGLAEFGIVGGCLLIYFLVRGNVVDEPAAAFAHAGGIVDLEKRLGFFWEPGWQRAIAADRFQIDLWNFVYFWLHGPAIVVVALWLYFRHRPVYGFIRNAFLVSALIALFLYAVYPVAPPRLMTASGFHEYGISGPVPNYGFDDTMRQYSAVSYQAESLRPFVNPFAAVPSLHLGWVLLIGIGVALALRNRVGLAIAVVWPVLMFFGITLTANHFIFDAIAGVAVALAGLAAAFGLERIPPRTWLRLTPPFLRQEAARLHDGD
ncbi:MAG TPA: phosphatase PAP2 family protein [Dehalococcoidia bacterium]|nr:phosphatase PAP2 family protein [Dehalococcoidia bacterium]